VEEVLAWKVDPEVLLYEGGPADIHCLNELDSLVLALFPAIADGTPFLQA
jgi:hypothetical protein